MRDGTASINHGWIPVAQSDRATGCRLMREAGWTQVADVLSMITLATLTSGSANPSYTRHGLIARASVQYKKLEPAGYGDDKREGDSDLRQGVT